MIRIVEVTLGAVILVAIAGGASADQLPPASPATTQQLSYTPGNPPPSAAPTDGDHFVKPPGYDEDRWMHPYGVGYGPKPK